MSVAFPLINGHRYSWASLELKADGLVLEHVKEVSYSHTLEPGDVRGTGVQKAGRTRGEYNAEGSITFLQEGWDEFRAHLGAGYMEKSFSFTAAYAEEGQAVTSDEIVGCRITSVEKNPSQGTDANEVTVQLNVMYIIEDGVEPLNNMRL